MNDTPTPGITPTSATTPATIAKTKVKNRTGPKVPRDWKVKFLASFAKTANVRLACQDAGVSSHCAYSHHKIDPEFAAAWDELKVNVSEILEAEAIRRAVIGTLKPVFQSGELVGHIREYSDSLLTLLLKANSEKYRDRGKVEVGLSGPGGGPVQIEAGPVLDRIAALAATAIGATADIARAVIESRDGPADVPMAIPAGDQTALILASPADQPADNQDDDPDSDPDTALLIPSGDAANDVPYDEANVETNDEATT